MSSVRRALPILSIVVLAACSGARSADSPPLDDGPTTSSASPGSSDDIVIPDNDIPSSSSTTATTAPTGTATAPNQDIILAADGQQNTDPFTLVEGSYSVQFDLRGACFYGADLTRLTPDSESALPTTITTGQGPVAGTTNLYDIDAGDYYIGMLTGPTPTCPWSIVLTRHTATP